MDVLNVFTAAYNWEITVNGVDPVDVIIGDTDFTGLSGTQLLDSMASTMELCYTVDSGNYEITFDECP